MNAMYIRGENFQISGKSSVSQGILCIKKQIIIFELLEVSDSWLWLSPQIYNAPVFHSQQNTSNSLYFVTLKTFNISIIPIYFRLSSDLLRHSIWGLGKTFLELYNYLGLTYFLRTLVNILKGIF